jgi:hypothetical protein
MSYDVYTTSRSSTASTAGSIAYLCPTVSSTKDVNCFVSSCLKARDLLNSTAHTSKHSLRDCGYREAVQGGKWEWRQAVQGSVSVSSCVKAHDLLNSTTHSSRHSLRDCGNAGQYNRIHAVHGGVGVQAGSTGRSWGCDQQDCVCAAGGGG